MSNIGLYLLFSSSVTKLNVGCFGRSGGASIYLQLYSILLFNILPNSYKNISDTSDIESIDISYWKNRQTLDVLNWLIGRAYFFK